jgi:S-adenosylmethionine-diacylglycerol 3-amino-3-carboxypropyl transferase
MKEETSGGMIEVYRERVKRLACQFPISDNYFGWQAFSRSYDRAARRAMPEYLKKENFQPLRQNLDRVQIHVSTLTQFLKTQPPESLDRFVFLDSQDWMRPSQLEDLWSEVARVGRPGSRIIFRTAAKNSPLENSLSSSLLKKFDYDEDQSLKLFQQDRSAIYGGFHLYIKRN